MISHRERLIEKLVTTLHLNVPERTALSPNSIGYSEVASVVSRLLDEVGYFPPRGRPWREGTIVHEGAVLEKLPSGRVRLTLQRSHPTNPNLLAEKREFEFKDIRAAVKAFIDLEWPRGIDGIAITLENVGF